MTTITANLPAPTQTLAKAEVPLTSGDAAKALNLSRTAVKTIALECHAEIIKTPGGQWLFPPAAVEKIRAELERRERERDR